jgi:hypothetical protein
MKVTKYANKICLPEPLHGLCSKYLLVMEMLEGKKLSEAIEDKLVVVLGGDRKLAHDFITRKREGEKHETICDSPTSRCETYITCFPSQLSYMKVWTMYQRKCLTC